MVSKIKKDPLLLIRLALGIAFIVHGATKLSDIEGGMGMFSSMGLPGFVFVVVALVELLAGLGILLNKYVKYSGYAIAVIMIGAIFLAKLKAGYLGGYELDIAYLAMALVLAMKAGCDCSSKTCSSEGHSHEDTEA